MVSRCSQFNLLNDALMILVRKTMSPTRLKDYHPISLMHSFSKLFARCLACHLAPQLKDIVKNNQSAFIKGRCIHDNFIVVHLACRWLHNRQVPDSSKKKKTGSHVLIKVDIAKAFDSVACIGPSFWRSFSTWDSRCDGQTRSPFSCPLQVRKFLTMADQAEE